MRETGNILAQTGLNADRHLADSRLNYMIVAEISFFP